MIVKDLAGEGRERRLFRFQGVRFCREGEGGHEVGRDIKH